MALMQCHGFFSKYPHIKLVEDIDTAYVGELIAKNQTKGVAAIAGEGAASKFGLQILQKNIEDTEHNYTRFLVIQDPANPVVNSQNSKLNKATISFSLSHEVGGLKNILDILAAHNINIMTIQSTPMVGKAWEYFFHMDIEFNDIALYYSAINTLKPFTLHLDELGVYSKGL
jgi:prephenate dehydratase